MSAHNCSVWTRNPHQLLPVVSPIAANDSYRLIKKKSRPDIGWRMKLKTGDYLRSLSAR